MTFNHPPYLLNLVKFRGVWWQIDELDFGFSCALIDCVNGFSSDSGAVCGGVIRDDIEFFGMNVSFSESLHELNETLSGHEWV